jgi:hypothetical protein
VRIFKNKWFAKFAQKEGISDWMLCQAIRDAEQGMIDADYGGGVIKQRIARQNEGKSGGYRTIILLRKGDKAFFVYGFAKNERANISRYEEREFKALAEATFAFSDNELAAMLQMGGYREVDYDAKNENL